MSEFGLVQTSVEIPSEINVSLKNKVITVNGPNGTLKRDFRFARAISIEQQENRIVIFTYHPRKKEKSLITTIKSHIENMIKGAQQNYKYKMKIVYAHFPMTVKVEGETILIENFLGERAPRVAKIYGKQTTVTVESDDLIIESPSIEEAGQTAANIQRITKIK
ncbi:MAG: 50S ribosomal protein L6, partial [Candidatus Helarchaeota archaeon]